MGRQRSTMIITQTPLRVGLLGGGTDLPEYYREHGGRVLNCAIDKYVYVIVKQRFDDDIYVNYSKKEIVSPVADIEHELVREAMMMTGVDHGVEITTLADIPSAGSGLGSSSAVTVGLLQALFAYSGRQVSARSWPNGPARSRSNAAASRSASRTSTSPPTAASATSASGRARARGEELDVARHGAPDAPARASCSSTPASPAARTRSLPSSAATSSRPLPQLDRLRDLAGVAADGLRGGDVEAVGDAMRESWEAKRKLAEGVSNRQIDDGGRTAHSTPARRAPK